MQVPTVTKLPMFVQFVGKCSVCTIDWLNTWLPVTNPALQTLGPRPIIVTFVVEALHARICSPAICVFIRVLSHTPVEFVVKFSLDLITCPPIRGLIRVKNPIGAHLVPMLHVAGT